MADNEKLPEISVTEANDGSATVDVPENLFPDDLEGGVSEPKPAEGDEGGQAEELDDHPDDDEELRAAKRNRRKAKKEAVRAANREKDLRYQQLQRENEEFKRRLVMLERNTKAESIVRIDKNIEDAQVRLEYAKMKLAEATQSQDGHGMVEAQTLWQTANDQIRQFQYAKHQAEQEVNRQQTSQNLPDPLIQRNAADWIRRNPWYDPKTSDRDSRVAKKVDELMVAEGWNPADPDYWDELDSRLQKQLPHRYNENNDDTIVKRPRNVVGSSGRESATAYGGVSRNQFRLTPDRVKAMKEAGAWDNPERKSKMIKQFMEFDRRNK
jgi:hypothetical protein